MKSRCLALLVSASAALVGGCFRSSAEVHEAVAASIGVDRVLDQSDSNQMYDFGTIFSDDQTLRHEFTIRNPSDRPMRLLRGEALTPCCSSIAPLPPFVEPHGEVKVLTTFRPGFQSGEKAVRFLVETEGVASQFQLAVRVQLVSAWATEPVEGLQRSIPLGTPGTLSLRIVARSKGSAGRGLPDKVLPVPPIAVKFVGPAAVKTALDGSIEASRDVLVSLPASTDPGLKRSELTFEWAEGRRTKVAVGWEVHARLKLVPAGLVLRRSSQPVERTIVIESDGNPFRVTSVGSSLLSRPVDLPVRSATRHSVRLVLDLLKGPLSGPVNVIIATDYWDQPSTILSVLVLPDADGTGGG